MIYISHPYGGKEENKQDVERIIDRLITENDKQTYISPIHAFGEWYDKTDYDNGLRMCLDLLKHCDIMYVYGDYASSVGCLKEIAYCNEHGIPYKIINQSV